VQRARPYARLVAFEGIGAGLYGCLARYIAMGCALLGDHDDAVMFARTAFEIDSRAGGVPAAESMSALAHCLEARDSGGDRLEAARLRRRAQEAFTSLGVTQRVAPRAPVAGQGQRAERNELRRDGDVWHVTFGDLSTIVKHSKGVADLSFLLTSPGREFHVTELDTVPRAAVADASGEALDRRAIAAYRQRLADLADDIDGAQAANDIGRVESLQAEHDTLVAELSRSLGLGGRARAAGPEPVERLRKAVSARVRDAIRRIEVVHPPLGRHLSHSVKTGVFCSYRPELAVTWTCQDRSGPFGG
jgi:hypothetical protein